MKKIRKHLLLGMVAFSAFALASCGSSSENEPKSSNEPTTSVEPDIDYGTVTIRDYEVAFMQEVIITPAFSDEEYAEELTYTFEGNNISITDGKIKGLVPGTTTLVTAKSEHHETTFNVAVTYLEAVLTNDSGAESKASIAVPEVPNYVLHFTVDVPVYVNQYTRLSSFAFNGSNNSWYNIEMGSDGRIQLFAHFNGIEKYFVFIGMKDDMLVNDAIHYTVDIAKQGQKTYFYVNDKVISGFNEQEMAGYPELGAMEVTAAADREGAGKYEVRLSHIYYELEDSEDYESYMNPAPVVEDCVLANEDGSEAKHSYGDLSLFYNSFLYSTTVDVETWDPNKTRPVAFAFNGSDNSWYNIEMDVDGTMNLFGHFNGVEKYYVYLGNANDMKVDGKIHFTVDILKNGEATYYFFNGNLVCWFTELEVAGYPKLAGFEVTACTDVWQDGGAFKVNLTNTTIINDKDAKYAEFYAKLNPAMQDAAVSAQDGAERHANNFKTPLASFVYSVDVVVTQDAEGWFRPSAFAFNNSDNSWYNIETGTDGNITLFARFNNVEKYFISLGTKAETTKDGVFGYHVDIVRVGVETEFYFNGVLKCNFTASEMEGYPPFANMDVTSCANREGKAYAVEFNNQVISTDISGFRNN